MFRILQTVFVFMVMAFTPVLAYHNTTDLLFTARLSGDQESPQVTTDAQGVAMFSINQATHVVFINASFSHLSGPITGVHIHEGAPGENGPVIINLGPIRDGNTLKGTIKDLGDEVLNKMLSGNYYINVHTDQHPAGEIRGQIGLETDYRYTALMNGFNEVPSVGTDAQGLGIFQLNHAQTSVNFKVVFEGLTSPVTGAHIHNAAAGMNGGVVFDLGPFINGNTIEGSWEPESLLSALLSGELYINVHTESNPGGEIRGQILLMPGITFDARLSGDQEVPAVLTPATGLGMMTISPDMTSLDYFIVFDNLSGPATGAHFHLAPAGENGGVVIDITGSLGVNGSYIVGSRPMNAAIFDALLRSQLYVNIHSDANPGGEIRGQVVKFAREAFSLDLTGGQEAPPISTSAGGMGVVSMDRDQTNIHFMINVRDLIGTFTSASFHQGPPTQDGDVIYDLTGEFNSFGGAYGYWDTGSDPPFYFGPQFLQHLVYLNILTTGAPEGEVRGNVTHAGQLFTDPPFDPKFGDNVIITALLTGDNEVPEVTTDAIGLATIYFDGSLQTAKINITATGLSGPITGVHIHEADPGTNGPVIFPLTNIGNRVQQEITGITDLELTSLLNGAMYINIHTAAHPNGEIRGQLSLDQDISFWASLNGDEEFPPVITNGKGLASIHWTLGQPSLDINVQLTNLSSDITGAHFHSGQPGENGPVIVDLTPLIEGHTLRGSVDIVTDDLLNLLLGNVYLNVHTVDNPGGEIRGQVNYLPGITFDGWMTPAQVVPFATSTANGLVLGTIFPGPRDLTLWMLTDQTASPVWGAYLQEAPVGTFGFDSYNLSTDLVDGNSIVHLGVLNDGMLSALLKGRLNLTAYSAAFQDGELRGQLFRLARDGYGFDLCKEQEPGTINAPNATGSGWLSIDRLHKNLHMAVVADGLTDDLTASHIHLGPTGANGPPIVDLTSLYTGSSMLIYGASVDTALVNPVRAGATYVNIHTPNHPGGEIRGQIVKENLCSLTVGVDPLADQLADVQLSPVPVQDQLHVELDVLDPGRYTISIIDLTGRSLSYGQYDLSSGLNEVVLPTQHLTSGFYSVVIGNGSAGKAFKFVK